LESYISYIFSGSRITSKKISYIWLLIDFGPNIIVSIYGTTSEYIKKTLVNMLIRTTVMRKGYKNKYEISSQWIR